MEIKEDAFLASLDENSNYKRQKAEYSDRLEESVADYLTEVLEGQAEWQDYCVERTEVRWEEREEHTDFGAITEITVYLKEKKEGNLEQDFEVIVIEPVLVEVFSEWDKKKETGDKEMEDKEIEDKEIEDKEIEGKKTSQKLTKLLAKCYHLREEDIEIKILE